jgi:hypothetical protein
LTFAYFMKVSLLYNKLGAGAASKVLPGADATLK